MHFLSSLLYATGFACLFFLSTVSASPSSSSPSRLASRSTSKTCSPKTSEYLYNVHADGLTKFGFMGHYSYIRLATNLQAPAFKDSDQLVWNLAQVGNESNLHQIQIANGSKCATIRGKDRKVGLSTCSSSSATTFEIDCASCGETSCGDPYANQCMILTTDSSNAKDQCLSRVGKLIMTKDCDEKDKTQKWGFNLA
ncbi:hypothetical protein JCM5353_002519 [Sporobolomyces roseus]